jgi:hypothetical protein
MVTKVYGDTGVDKIVDGAVTSSDFAAGVGGKILQVVTAQKTDTFSTNSTSFVDVTGLSVSITPSSASSKILILASLSLGNDGTHCSARIYRDAVSIAKGDSAGSRIRATWHASPPSTA